MAHAGFLEWALSRFTPEDRAHAIVGDLAEVARVKGRAWFWLAYARVLARLAWRAPVAWAVGYAMAYVAAAAFYSRSAFDLDSHNIGIRVAEPTGSIAMLALLVVCFLSPPLWFVAPYGALRFGLHDPMSRLAVPVCGAASLGFWLCHPQAMGIRSTAVQHVLMIGCAVAIVMVVAAALVQRRWRPVIALSATACAYVGATLGAVTALLFLAYRYQWNDSASWVSVRVGCAIGCCVGAAAYSGMHTLLRGRLRTFLGAASLMAFFGAALFGVALANLWDRPH